VLEDRTIRRRRSLVTSPGGRIMSEPQSPEQANCPEPQSLADRQRQVEALADEYLERLLAGETPNRQALLVAHPDLADLLQPRLALADLMHRVARAERRADGPPGTAEVATASGDPLPVAAERALRVKCPHCGNHIQLVEPATGEVTCGGCGSS